ncbi:MAG: T9SS type A sorting domain-containing protein [Saprospiraceae bacterium]|nr:T9SS type A sorting domain-containing protein [Saprospiraceae bacterium]
MKELKRSILLWVLFLPCLVQSQTWFQEADVWHYELEGFVAFRGYERIQYDRDTTLHGQVAKVIRIETRSINYWADDPAVNDWVQERIVREHGDTLFVYLEETFYPLYNFSLEVGDTLAFPIMEVGDVLCHDFPPLLNVVMETGEMELEGETFRFQRWRMENLPFGSSAEALVLEGIGVIAIDFPNWEEEDGELAYLFYPYNGDWRCATDMPRFDFRCFSNEQIDYTIGDLPCDFIVLNTKEQDDIKQFQIAPNPIDQSFSIQLPEAEKLESITLFTLEGKAMKTFSGQDTKNLYIGDFRSGMYVIRLKLADQRLAFGRIMKL